MSGNHPCDAYNTKHRMHNNDWDADGVKSESGLELQNVRVDRGGGSEFGVNGEQQQHTFRGGSTSYHAVQDRMSGPGGYVGFEETSSNMSPNVNFSENTSCIVWLSIKI